MIVIPERESYDKLIDPERACIVLEPSARHRDARQALSFRASQLGFVEDVTLPAPPERSGGGALRIEQTLRFHIGDLPVSSDGYVTVKQSFELGRGEGGGSDRQKRAPRGPLVAQTARALWLRGEDALPRARKLATELHSRLGRATAVPAYRLPGAEQWYAIDPWILDVRVRQGELPKALHEALEFSSVHRFGGRWVTGLFRNPEIDPYKFAQAFYELVGDSADLGLRTMPLVLPVAGVPPQDYFYTHGVGSSTVGQQANLDTIQAQGAWNQIQALPTTFAQKSVKIFLIDVGVTPTIDSPVDTLSASMIGVTVPPPYPTDTAPPLGASCHGTQMTGIMDAPWGPALSPQSIAGICGNCPEITVVSVKCSSLGEVALGVDYAAWCVQHAPGSPMKGIVVFGLDVLQLCAQANSTPALQSDLCKFQDALRAAQAAGPDLLAVLPAGNFQLGDPSDIPNVITIAASTVVVGATNAPPDQNTRWPLSRFATLAGGVHPAVSAPGAFVVSVMNPADYELDSGTSFAAAHVAGVAALMRMVSPTRTAADIAGLLASTATPCGTALQLGAGRLNASAAITAALT